MATVKKAICRLPNGKLYYFDAKGIRITKKGWQKASPSQCMQLGKKGYVIGKLEKKAITGGSTNTVTPRGIGKSRKTSGKLETQPAHRLPY